MRRRLVLPVMLAVLVAGCATTPPGSAPTDIGVEVTCGEGLRRGECPSGDLRLEIGDQAWTLADGPGSASMQAAVAVTPVRAVDAASCVVLIDFQADPGHRYFVELAADGHATAVDLEDQEIAFEPGPGLVEAPVSGCE